VVRTRFTPFVQPLAVTIKPSPRATLLFPSSIRTFLTSEISNILHKLVKSVTASTRTPYLLQLRNDTHSSIHPLLKLQPTPPPTLLGSPFHDVAHDTSGKEVIQPQNSPLNPSHLLLMRGLTRFNDSLARWIAIVNDVRGCGLGFNGVTGNAVDDGFANIVKITVFGGESGFPLLDVCLLENGGLGFRLRGSAG